ncbi:RHS repeat domain-containing protein [Novipirellula sp.]|uniref:RHS repeat domain-containing protein n=1 Tax=Novipirellula sp. TaxID=2795430 RepID=UPI00356AC449
MRYIDDLVARDRDISPSGGLLGERLYFLADANWNTTAIVDASGIVRERYEYDPYGILSCFAADFTPRSSSNYNVLYTYTSREWTPVASLYYFRNRWYDPQLGRFSSRDPIGYEGSMWSLYEYVMSGPLIAMDPLGLQRGVGPVRPGIRPGTGQPSTRPGTRPGSEPWPTNESNGSNLFVE